jgi:hypothetical protein
LNTFAKMIERMEDLILAGVSLPLTPWTVVHGDKLVPLLDRIRESLPDEVRQAQRIIEHRDELLTDAQRKAIQILDDSKQQAERMLSESELLKAVHAEADRIRSQVWTELETLRKKTQEEVELVKSQAYEEARTVRDGADHYAETILGSLDKSLGEFHAVVRNGQKHLKRSKADANQYVESTTARSKKRHQQLMPDDVSVPMAVGSNYRGKTVISTKDVEDLLTQTELHS